MQQDKMLGGIGPRGVLLLAFAALFVVSTSACALLYVFPAPFADMVDTEGTLSRWQKLGEPWGPLLNWRINEHLSPVGALFFAVHRVVFASNETFLVVVNLIAWAGVAALVGLNARRLGAPAWAALALCGWLFWPGVTGANLAWGQQIPIFLGVLLSVAALSLASRAENWIASVLAVTLAWLAAFTFGWGLAAPAMVALTLAAQRRPALEVAGAAMAALAAALLFFLLSPRVGAGLGLADLGFAMGLAIAVVGSVIEKATAGWEAAGLALGAGAGALGLWVSIRTLLRRDRAQAFFAMLALWALAGAAMTGLARAEYGVSQGFASRYAVLSGLYWSALICLLGPRWNDWDRRLKWAVTIAGFVLAAGAIAVTPKGWLLFQRNYNDVAAAAIGVMLRAPDAVDPAAYPRPARALSAYDDLQTRELSLYRAPLGRALGRRAPAAPEPCRQSGTLAVTAVRGGALQLTGEVDDAPVALRRMVLAVDGNGIVRGLAAVGVRSNDPGRFSRPFLAGVARADAPRDLSYVLIADGRACVWRPDLNVQARADRRQS